MKARYQKPVARNLGEIIFDVEGYCQKGSVATGSGVNCDNGGLLRVDAVVDLNQAGITLLVEQEVWHLTRVMPVAQPEIILKNCL